MQQIVAQYAPYFVAAYAVSSVLGHALPQQWWVTKLCLRLAANLKPAAEETKK